MSMYGRTSPTSEPGAKRAIMVMPGWNNSQGFGSIIGTVVRTVDVADQWDGKDAIGYRNACWSSNKATAFYVGDLELYTQLNLPMSEGDGPYGNSYQFRCHGIVDEKEATAMAKTYQRLRAAHEKIADNEGRIGNRDYAHFLLRNAAILGCTEFLFPVDPANKHMTLSNLDYWQIVKSRAEVYERVNALVDWFRRLR